MYLVDAARQGIVEMVTSDYLLAEILCQPDPIRCIDVMRLTSPASLHVSASSIIESRAQLLSAFKISGNDALHVVAAEASDCDFFLTTDDRLQKRCHRAVSQSAIAIRVLNPTEILPYLEP